MHERACLKAKEMGKLHNSITNGDGNIAGFLGEEVANSILGGVIDNTYDYDIVSSGIKYDVKTKRCTSKPRLDYDCSVAAYNVKQQCHRYVFVRVLNTTGLYSRAWALGWIDKNEYFKISERLYQGQIDTSNGFLVKADCYNLKINKLNQF